MLAIDTTFHRCLTMHIGLQKEILQWTKEKSVSQYKLDMSCLWIHFSVEEFLPFVHLRIPIQRVGHAKHRVEGLVLLL